MWYAIVAFIAFIAGGAATVGLLLWSAEEDKKPAKYKLVTNSRWHWYRFMAVVA